MTLNLSRKFLTALRLFAAALFLGALAHAADPPDTLTLADGEKLVGKLVRATGAAVTFHSDSAGDVTIPWAKIKELTSSRRFAVIPKGIVFKRKETDAKIPRGVLAFTDGKIQITPAQRPAGAERGHRRHGLHSRRRLLPEGASHSRL